MVQVELSQLTEKFSEIFSKSGVPNWRTITGEQVSEYLEQVKAMQVEGESPEQHQADLLSLLFLGYVEFGKVNGSLVMDTTYPSLLQSYIAKFSQQAETRPQAMQLMTVLYG